MQSITLSEKAIEGINSFIESVASIPAVEAVYLLTYQYNINHDIQPFRNEVVVIYNQELHSNSINAPLICDNKLNAKILCKKIDSFQLKYAGERLDFKMSYLNEFNIRFSDFREKLNLMSLANGTVLFDRCGRATRLQKIARDITPHYSDFSSMDILPVENIQELQKKKKYTKEVN